MILGATLVRLTGPLWKQCGLAYSAGALAGLALAPVAASKLAPEFHIHGAVFVGLAMALFGFKLMGIYGDSSMLNRG